jgi:dolichol-phosphate mannosyltransferase
MLAHLVVWPLADAADPLSGFFAARKDRLLALKLTPDSFDLGLELLAQNGGWLRILDVPVPPAGADRSLPVAELLNRGRRLMALGGGSITFGRATRFAGAGLVAMLVDLAVFQTLLWLGVRLGSAHIGSFVISAALNFQLNARWTFVASARETGEPLRRQYVRFLGVAVVALLLRGGVLGLFSARLGLPPQLGILFGIGTAAVANFLGNAFYVFPTGRAHVPGAMRWRMAALAGFAVILMLRLVYIGQPNLLPEEAYYWNYAQHLDIGYLDHPPMVAWLIALGTSLFGDTEFGVRIAAVACWFAASAFGFAYAQNLFGKSAAFVTALLIAVLPYYFGAGLIMSPDAPLVAAWAAALYFLERALLGERRAAWWGVGAAIGLGMLSKYSIALLGPAALVFAAIDLRARRWLLRPEPYLGVLLTVVIFLPVLWWNLQNDWASFVFQGPRRIASHFYFGLPELIGEVLLLLTPIGAVAAALALIGRNDAATDERRFRFIVILTLTPVAVFAAFSLSHAVKLNWTGPAWLAVLPAVAAGILATGPAAGAGFAQRLRLTWSPLVAVLLLLYAMGLHYLVLGLPGVPYRNDLRGLPLGWTDFVRQMTEVGAEVTKSTGRAPLYVGIDKYTFASEIAFYGANADGARPRVAAANLFGGDGLMYERWLAARDQQGRTLVLIAYKAGDLEAAAIAARCPTLGPIVPHQALKEGRKVGRFFHRICTDYHAAAGN